MSHLTLDVKESDGIPSSEDNPPPLESFRENEKDEGKEGEGGEGNPSECEKKEEGVLSTVIKLQTEIPPTHCVETSHAKRCKIKFFTS